MFEIRNNHNAAWNAVISPSIFILDDDVRVADVVTWVIPSYFFTANPPPADNGPNAEESA